MNNINDFIQARIKESRDRAAQITKSFEESLRLAVKAEYMYGLIHDEEDSFDDLGLIGTYDDVEL